MSYIILLIGKQLMGNNEEEFIRIKDDDKITRKKTWQQKVAEV